MPRTFEVQTGARLHFGPLASGASSGRRFGGIGMMVDSPGLTLRATEAALHEIHGGTPQANDRIERVCKILESGQTAHSPLSWKVASPAPEHAGFGTGTQLSLAAASILIRRQTGSWPSAREMASLLGRGKRSAIGIHGFDSGGFLVDAGQAGLDAIGDLAVRVEFPTAWRVLLVRRSKSPPGLFGSAELAAFEQLPPMSSELTDRLCRIVLTSVLPELWNQNCEEFTLALAEYGCEVGHYFSPVQGGVFADPLIGHLSESLRSRLVQSSWGPTVVTFADSNSAADELRSRILRELGEGWHCESVAPRNQSAVRSVS